uniref:Uncharacterized protein n=1 Tax=Compsopogon caeruleus TaxID=31354 RepID=A0A7S1THZ3_9RHOD
MADESLQQEAARVIQRLSKPPPPSEEYDLPGSPQVSETRNILYMNQIAEYLKDIGQVFDRATPQQRSSHDRGQRLSRLHENSSSSKENFNTLLHNRTLDSLNSQRTSETRTPQRRSAWSPETIIPRDSNDNSDEIVVSIGAVTSREGNNPRATLPGFQRRTFYQGVEVNIWRSPLAGWVPDFVPISAMADPLYSPGSLPSPSGSGSFGYNSYCCERGRGAFFASAANLSHAPSIGFHEDIMDGTRTNRTDFDGIDQEEGVFFSTELLGQSDSSVIFDIDEQGRLVLPPRGE